MTRFRALAVGAGAIGVWPAGCVLADGDGNPATSDGYRLRSGSVTVIDDARSLLFDTYVRLNRPIPRSQEEDGTPIVHGVIASKGAHTLSSASRVGRKSRHCYVGSLDAGLERPRVLRNPKPGQRVAIEVRIDGLDQPLRGYTTLIAKDSSPKPDRRLGC